MIRSSTVTLITGTPEPRGAFVTPAEEGREVFCDVQSVGMREAYEAMAHGHHPEWVLVLSDYGEYQGERICSFEGTRYRIMRTYVRSDYAIELTLEREEGGT